VYNPIQYIVHNLANGLAWNVIDTTHCDLVYILCDEIPICEELCRHGAVVAMEATKLALNLYQAL